MTFLVYKTQTKNEAIANSFKPLLSHVQKGGMQNVESFDFNWWIKTSP